MYPAASVQAAALGIADGAALWDVQAIVGRVRERRAIENCLEAATRGEGQVVLVEGEAGIGKTRLLAEVAKSALALGMRVAWGRSWDRSAAPPYWPWLEVLRDLELAEGVSHANEFAPFSGVDPRREQAASVGDAGDRILLFDAVARRLVADARLQPLVILLDDLHAADDDSLLLADFVCCRLASARICVVAAARPLDSARSASPWVRSSTKLSLAGLEANEVTELLARHVARQAGSNRYVVPDSDLVPRLLQLTAGNPFYLQETFAWLVCSSSAGRIDVHLPSVLHIPARLQGAIEARLASLPETARDVLAVAAVIGRDFHVDLVERLWRRSDRRTGALDLLHAALSNGLIELVHGSSGMFQFSHDLIREHLHAWLPNSERAAIHAEIAAWVEGHPAWMPSGTTATIAYHLQRANEYAPPSRVAEATALAARDAFNRLAFSESVRHWDCVLRLLDTMGWSDELASLGSLRSEALLGKGRALNQLSRRDEARTVLKDVIEMARHSEDANLFGAAVLAYGGEVLGTMEVAKLDAGPGAVFQDSLARLLRDALRRTDDASSQLRARLMSRLALEEYFVLPQQEREALADQAVQVARAAGDERALGEILCEGVVATWSPDNALERVAMAREAIGLGQLSGATSIEAAARVLTVNALFELGDTDSVRAEAAAMMHLEDRAPLPLLQWQATVYRGMRAFAAGDLRAAESLFAAGLQLGAGQHAWLTYLVQMLELRVVQRRADEMRDSIGLIKAIADRYEGMGYLQATVSYLYLQLGEEKTAAEYFDRAEALSFSQFRRDITYVTAMVRISEVAVALPRERAANSLYQLLMPYADQFSLATYGGCSLGSVERTLGKVAASLGRKPDAESHLRRAISKCGAMDSWLWVAHAQLDLALLLVEKSEQEPCDRESCLEEARRLAEMAKSRFETMELAALKARCEQLQRAIGASGSFDSGSMVNVFHVDGEATRVQVATRCRFSFDGDQWKVGFADRVVHVRASRGMEHLAVLVGHPGREFHCIELVRQFGASAMTESVEMPLAESHAGEIIDARAKAEYRRRLQELRSQVEEAETAGRSDVAERMRDEIDALAEQLRGALGLGGRARQAGSHVERCRLNVTRTIHAAVDRIARLDAECGAHLRQSIRTGHFCSYLGEQLRRRSTSGRRSQSAL